MWISLNFDFGKLSAHIASNGMANVQFNFFDYFAIITVKCAQFSLYLYTGTGMVDGISVLNGDASITCVRLLVRFHSNSTISFVDFLIKILFFSTSTLCDCIWSKHSFIHQNSVHFVCVCVISIFRDVANQFIRTVSIIFSIYDWTLQVIRMEWSSRFCL